MARKIRFPLKMKNGAEVRTLDELKANFDLESILGYFTDGKLATWLADRYYDEKAEAVSAMSTDITNLNAKLCEILEVEYQCDDDDTDLKYIQRRNEKYRILSSFTDDKEILDNIDIVAMNQDDLYDILDEGTVIVYLYGEKYAIPFGRKNICYIGINNPLVILDKSKEIYEYIEANISFKNVQFEKGINQYITKGEILFSAGKCKEAYPYIENAANNGNPRAMYLMGLYYYWGYNTVHIDTGVRNNWFKKGYEGGDPLATYWYAKWCLKDGSEEQTSLYRSIFEKVKEMADSGDNFAQHTLGSMYENGRGIDKNRDSGHEYYKRSAEQGCALGQNNLGSMYEFGDGVVQDYAEAVKWYSKSAEQGCAIGQDNLGWMYFKGYGVTQDYSKAFEWYKKAAEQAYSHSLYVVGELYREGNGVKKDYIQAVEWYRKAAELGQITAQFNLGLMYENGESGITKNYAEAVKWYRKAAEQGHDDAQLNLGYMYGRGYGVSRDKSKAIEWYKKAAAQGNKYAQKNLKNMGIYKW